jgi:hypothetical protein
VQGQGSAQNVPGGYTLIGSTRLLNGSQDVFTQSQAGQDLPEGGVVGALTRNDQSQWVIRNATPALPPDSDPNGQFDPNVLSEIAFKPGTPWPTGGTEAERQADAYIGRIMFRFNPPADVREYYQHIGEDWGGLAADLNQNSKYDYPADGLDPSTGQPLAFGPDIYGKVRSELEQEMRDVDQVQTAINHFEMVFGSARINSIVNESTIANSIIDSIEPPKTKTTSVDPWAIISNVLKVASAASSIGGPATLPLTATLGVMGNGGALAESVIPQTKVSGGTPISQQITDKAGQIAAAINAHYENLGNDFDHIYALMVSDWGKLQAASGEAVSFWNLYDANSLVQTFTTADKGEYARGLVPLVFHEYVIHPVIHSVNKTPWVPNTYRCRDHDDDKMIHPFGGSNQAAAGRTSHARYTRYQRPVHSVWIMGQALSTKVDWEDESIGQLQDTGRLPPPGLINDLFSPLGTSTPSNDPVGPLQMDKPVFYGNPSLSRNGITCIEGNGD